MTEDGKPFRVKLELACVRPFDELKRNAEVNQQWPRAQPPKLAIVGGAPSVAEHMDELRAWTGHIWAVNYMAAWFKKQGIRSTMITVDPQDFDPGNIDDALLGTCCNPELFSRLSERGVKIRAFDLAETHEGGIASGVTSARRAMSLALMLGYRDIHVFGCDGSYPTAAESNVDRSAAEPLQLIIKAGGGYYLTHTGFITQCEEIAQVFRTFGYVFKNRSSGLLAAMVEHWDTWECAGVSTALKEHMEALHGPSGIWDEPFKRDAA